MFLKSPAAYLQYIDAFWRLFSRQLFDNLATKEEIASFQIQSIIVLSFKGSYKKILGMISKTSAAEMSYMGKG